FVCLVGTPAIDDHAGCFAADRRRWRARALERDGARAAACRAAAVAVPARVVIRRNSPGRAYLGGAHGAPWCRRDRTGLFCSDTRHHDGDRGGAGGCALWSLRQRGLWRDGGDGRRRRTVRAGRTATSHRGFVLNLRPPSSGVIDSPVLSTRTQQGRAFR